MLERYKRMENGHRKLAELLECTPASRRDRIIKTGMDEDYMYMETVLTQVMLWEDLLSMSSLEIAELTHRAKPGIIAMAISRLDEEQQKRFLVNTEYTKMGKIKDSLEYSCSRASDASVVTARLDLVGVCRELMNEGKIPFFQRPTEKAKEIFKL